jgi:hypothetical protein
MDIMGRHGCIVIHTSILEMGMSMIPKKKSKNEMMDKKI